jgi:hypothetical protein
VKFSSFFATHSLSLSGFRKGKDIDTTHLAQLRNNMAFVSCCSTIAQRSAERFTANGNHDSEINELKHNLERFAENITNRLEVLNEEVININ